MKLQFGGGIAIRGDAVYVCQVCADLSSVWLGMTEVVEEEGQDL